MVEYSYAPNTRTQINHMTDLASGARVADSRLSKRIAEEANNDLPRWLAFAKLTRATGVFHVRILQSGEVEIVETGDGFDAQPRNFVEDPDVTPEMIAAHEGRIDVLKKLLDAGGPVNAKDQLGDTALMAALGSHKVEVVHLLLERGADPNARSLEGDSALWLSVLSRQSDMTKELIEHGAVIDCNNPADQVEIEIQSRLGRLPPVLARVAKTCRSPNHK